MSAGAARAGQRRVVVRESVTRDEIDDAMHANRWWLANISSATEASPSQVVFLTADRHDVLVLFDDRRLGATYFAVSGPTADDACLQIRRSLATYGEAEIRRMLTAPRDRDEHVRGIYFTALTAPDACDAHLLQAFAEAARHDDPAVRHALVSSLHFVDWPEIAPLLAAMAKDDADASIAQRAAELREAKRAAS